MNDSNSIDEPLRAGYRFRRQINRFIIRIPDAAGLKSYNKVFLILMINVILILIALCLRVFFAASSSPFTLS